MNRIPDESCAAICGLFCGACPAYPDQCHGCLSDFVRDCCRECKNGFRTCAAEHHVSHCCDCAEFPCERMARFIEGPIINGVNNHAHAIPDSIAMREKGVARWIQDETRRYTCDQCGARITWYDKTCPKCGHAVSQK